MAEVQWELQPSNRQLGEFLSALHAFPPGEAAAMGFSTGWNGWRESAARRFEAELAPLLSDSARERALDFLASFSCLCWEAVAIHGDFYPPVHLFFDPEREQLSGVIDFGDLTLDDAAADFRDILRCFGEPFARDVLAYYTCPAGEEFVERIHWHIRADAIFNAAFALEYGFNDRLEKQLPGLETAFSDAATGRIHKPDEKRRKP